MITPFGPEIVKALASGITNQAETIRRTRKEAHDSRGRRRRARATAGRLLVALGSRLLGSDAVVVTRAARAGPSR
jgi:hypothetical protein